MNKNDLYESIKYLLIIIFLILVVIFRENMKVLVCIGGIALILVGIIFLIQKKTNGLLILSLGVSIICSFLLYIFKILVLADVIIFLLTSTVIFTFISYLFVEFVTRRFIYKTYTIRIEAVVVDLIKNNNTKKEYYKPLLQYEVNGNVYDVMYPYFIKSFLPKIGDSKKILVNPDDNTEVYFVKEKIEDIKSIVISLFFIISAFIILIGLF